MYFRPVTVVIRWKGISNEEIQLLSNKIVSDNKFDESDREFEHKIYSGGQNCGHFLKVSCFSNLCIVEYINFHLNTDVYISNWR